MRKTIDVGRVQRIANDMLRDSVDECKDGRTAIAVMLETILMETGNYKGFCFTDLNDETRRAYYYSTATAPASKDR